MHQDHSVPVVAISEGDDSETPSTSPDVPQFKTAPQPHSHSCGDDSCHLDHGEEKWIRNVGIPQRHHAPKIGRNDPCFCRSGKKYKKCCLGVVAPH